ncbi:hypothetical protein Tsubulata_037823 [Turnera subulata]|uniref:Uncharacterized protein n=1 Tax=Turnera subulata TaxID=218843 RepID=A0A9Q0GGL1_9ROSI|nr:hypothetical protein Tsubulata_037823 [Turnera subulata]
MEVVTKTLFMGLILHPTKVRIKALSSKFSYYCYPFVAFLASSPHFSCQIEPPSFFVFLYRVI